MNSFLIEITIEVIIKAKIKIKALKEVGIFLLVVMKVFFVRFFIKPEP